MNTAYENQIQEMAIHAGEAAALLKELANTSRLMICCCLIEGEQSVSQLNERVPLSQSALSQHLSRLRDARLLVTRKEAQTVYYRLGDDKVIKIISTLKAIYCP